MFMNVIEELENLYYHGLELQIPRQPLFVAKI
jgi:hypothetical protein